MSLQSKFLQASGSARKMRDRLLASKPDGSSNGAEDGSHGGLQGECAGGGWGCCVVVFVCASLNSQGYTFIRRT